MTLYIVLAVVATTATDNIAFVVENFVLAQLANQWGVGTGFLVSHQML